MNDETTEPSEDDHKPECPMRDPQFPKHPLEDCDYCNVIRGCEERVRAACIAAVENVPVRGTWTAHKVIEETLAALRKIQP
jgi:hypothetical protein